MTKTKMMISLVLTVWTITGCVKETDNCTPDKPGFSQLVKGPWQLVAHGYDLNDDYRLDPGEDKTRTCEKDNEYIFHENYTGTIKENAVVCSGSQAEQNFQWSLNPDQTEITVGMQRMRILRLDYHTMVLAGTFTTAGTPVMQFRR